VVAALGALGLELLVLGLAWRFARGGRRLESQS
jgi:hypothetical protein